ncbi:hypothetical protein J5O04_11400 [Corynebacterium hindlerae]|uniref:hypothetical protein n=1 Tax=Corynebacterium hindlerae TaxID=699041 RepID=UPI001AD636F2|nr:hypothetical protein [Corynebacterium hindlerae]QTH59388.1 hypothetical protein J5O04_11400 [Corynebacterium hindlerae]
MSISRHIDEYVADHGIAQSDEVVPESECQVFDGMVADSDQKLAKLRERVADVLNNPQLPPK